MANVNPRKVNEAIRDCLRQCEEGPDILAGFEGFLLSLSAEGGWHEAELHEVETGVRRVLYGILHGVTYAGDAKNRSANQSAPDDYRTKVSGA
jgi:hypothetical protein